MGNGQDPTDDELTPAERARRRLQKAKQRRTPTVPEDSLEGDPTERARNRLQKARQGRTGGDGATDQQAEGGPDLPEPGTLGIPEPQPDTGIPGGPENDPLPSLLETIVTEGERGFRMFQQQTAADRALDAADREETAGQTAVSRQSGLGPGTIAEEEQELSDTEIQKVQERAAKQITKAEEELRSIEQTEAMKNLSAAIQSGEGGEFWNALWENPSAAVGLSVQSSAMQPDALIMSGLASLASPAAAVATGPIAANAVESRAAITQAMRDRGVDMTNAEAVMKTLKDPEFRAEAREIGRERGASIAAVDLATNLITAGLGRTALRPLAKGALGFGIQTGGEATSEAAAQAAADQEQNLAEISAEAVGAAPLSAIETAGTAFQEEPAEARARRQTQQVLSNLEETTAEDAEGQQAGNLQQMDEQTLETALEMAREQGRDEDVQRIEQELNRRQQADETEATADEEGDSSSQEDGEVRDDEQGAGPRGAPRAREGRPEDPQQAARQALERAREARQQDDDSEAGRQAQQTRATGEKLRVQDLPEDPAPDVGRREEGQQQELEEDMGARQQTRPEEQVDEAVQQVENELEEARAQRDQAEANFKDQVADVETETLQQLRRDVEDERALELIDRVIEDRRETAIPDELRGQPQEEDPTETQKPSLFPDRDDQVMSALQQAARRFAQRQAGVEAKEEELRQVKPQQAERRQEAREAQQDIEDEAEQEGPDTESEPEQDTDEQTREQGRPRTDTEREQAEESDEGPESPERPAPEPEQRQETEQEPGRAEPAPPPGESRVRVQEPVPAVEREREAVEEGDEVDTEGAAEETDVGTGREGAPGQVAPGTVEVATTTPDGETTRTQADLTDEAVVVESVENERQAKALAEVAASRDLPLRTAPEADLQTAEAVQRLANQGYEVRRAGDIERRNGGYTSPEGTPAFRVEAPQIDREQPTMQTEEGYEVGRADRTVTRRTTREKRPQGQMTDRPVEELQQELDEAIERGDEQFADQVRQALNTIREQGRQTTYSHSEGDIVVTNPDGRLVDRRSPRYDDLVAEYMAENERQLREGTVEPQDPSDPTGTGAALQSSSPLQVLETYRLALQQEEEVSNLGDLASPQAQAIENIGRLQTDSVRDRAGDALVGENGALTMNWLSPDGKPLDAAAQEITSETGIETTPQDIIDYIEANPTRSRRTDSERLAEHFKDLTGINLTEDLADRVISELRPDDPPSPEDVPDVDAPFQTISEEGPATAAELVEFIVRRIADDMQIPAGEINVAARPDDLPGPIAAFYERATRRAGEGQIRPAFFMDGEDGGQVYLIASGIEKAARALGMDVETFARASLMHEVTGHRGLRGLLGDQFEQTMDAMAQAIGRDRLINTRTLSGDRLIDANADQLETNDQGQLTDESLRLLVDEYLARVAEGIAIDGTTQRTLFTRLKEGFVSALGLRPTDSQIELLLQASRDHLRGLQKENPVRGSAFDRRMGGANNERWMVLGTSASDFDEAQREPTLFEEEDISVSGVFRGPYDNALRFEIDDSDAAFHPDGPIKELASLIETRERARNREYQAVEDEEAAEAKRERLGAQSEIERLTDQLMTEGVPLRRVLDHDVLFEQYPELGELTVELRDWDRDAAKGRFQREQERILLDTDIIEDMETAMNKQASSLDMAGPGPATLREALSDWMRMLIHEMQHWVQYEEGFAVGANPRQQAAEVQKQLNTAKRKRRQYDDAQKGLWVAEQVQEMERDPRAQDPESVFSWIRENVEHSKADFWVREGIAEAQAHGYDPESVESFMNTVRQEIEDRGFELNDAMVVGVASDEMEREFILNTGRERYFNHAGEIEARRAAERAHMSFERRKQEPFYDEELTETAFPEEEVVVRFSTQSERPNQLELFRDPDTEVEKNLVAVHNLNESDVRFAVDQMDGHIPVPSVAVARYEHGFDRFGKISLVGTPELVDPNDGVPVYDSDVWSPTAPRTQYNHIDERVTQFFRDAEPYATAVDARSDLSALDHKARVQDDYKRVKSRLTTDDWAKMMYLDEVHDREIEVPMKDPEPEYVDLLRRDVLAEVMEEIDSRDDIETRQDLRRRVDDGYDTFDPELHEQLVTALRAASRKVSMARLGEHNREFMSAVRGGVLQDRFLDPSGVATLWSSWQTMQEGQVVDTSELTDVLDEAIEEESGAETVRAAMSEWAAEKADAMFGDPYIEDPATGQELPITLQNIVDAMTAENVKVGEDAMLTSLKNERARGANRFRSMGEMQNQRDRIVDQQTMEQVKEQLKDEWDQLRDQMDEHLTDAVRRFERIEQPTKALADMLQRRVSADQARESLDRFGYDVEEMPTGQITAFVEFGETLLQSPTQYFEAKPQRAVALEEFEAAVVPDTAPEDLKDALSDAVGRVETYTDGDLTEREQVFQEVASDRDLRFQSISPEQMASRFITANDGERAEMAMNQNLVALHNLERSSINWVLDEMDGYIPAPSLAITKAEEPDGYAVVVGGDRFEFPRVESPEEARRAFREEMRVDENLPTLEEAAQVIGATEEDVRVEPNVEPEGMTKFGDVTLLAPPPMVDPAEEPVFAADAYTPRTPDVREEISEESFRALQDDIERIIESDEVMDDLLIGDAINEEIIDRFIGGQPQPTPEQFTTALDQFLDAEWDDFNARLQEGQNVRPNVWTVLLWADEIGLDVASIIEGAAFESWAGTQFLDNEFRAGVGDAVDDAAAFPRDRAANYVRDRIDRQKVFDHPRTFETIEATPENIVDAMMDVEQAGLPGEEFATGTGPTRAIVAEQFDTFEEMQQARDRAIPKRQMHTVKGKADDQIVHLRREIETFEQENLFQNPRHTAEQYLQDLARQETPLDEMSVEQAVDVFDDHFRGDVAELRRRADKLDEDLVDAQNRLNEKKRAVINAKGTATYYLGSRELPTEFLDSFSIELLRELVMSPATESGTDLEQEMATVRDELQNELVMTYDLNPVLQGQMDPRNATQQQALELYRAVDGAFVDLPRMEPDVDSELHNAYNEFLEEARSFRSTRSISEDASQAQTRLNGLQSIAEQALESGNWLRTAETQYFEAKPTRAVPISEFRAALVPDYTSDDLIERLEEQGLEVRTYENREERRELQGEFKDVRFQTTGFFAENDADVPIERPDQLRTLQDHWDWVRSHMRRLFTNRGDLPESVFDANIEKEGWLKSTIQRVKWAVEDFRAALQDEYGDDLTETEVRRINEALGNGFRRHDVTQAEIFQDDPEIESAVPATELFFAEIPLTPEAARQEKTYIEDLPERVQDQVADMREMVDEMSRAGIKTGLFAGQLRMTVEENMGTYLTRSYRIHDDPDYGDTLRRFAREQADELGIEMNPDEVPEDVPAEAWNRAVGWFRQNHPHMSEEQIQGRLLQMLRVDDEATDNFISQELGQIPGEIYARRQDIPEALRALLGQYEDPSTNFQRSMVKMAHGIANQTFLNEVKRKGLNRFLFEEPQVRNGTEYTEQIGENVGEAMEPLAGLYTTPEIAQAFRTFNTSPNMPAWQEWLMKAAVTLKLGKTVGSVRTQFRNYYGNILFALSQGHLFSPRVGAAAAAGAAGGVATLGPVGAVAGAGVGIVGGLSTTQPKREAWSFALKSLTGNFDTEEARAEWQRMLQLGVVGDAVRAGEFQALVEDLDVDLDDPNIGMGDITDWIVKNVGGTAEKLYQLGDEIWKVYAYKIEKERYASAKPNWFEQRVEEKAANVVRNTYPTYSLVPEIVKKLRRLPTNAPFVSFFSEVFRTTFHSMRIAKEDLSDPDTRAIGMQRAVGMVMAQGVMKVLYEVSKYLTGFDDDDDEYLRRLLPSWSQFSNIFHLPSEDGKASYIDLGYLNPYKGYSEAVIAMMQGDDVSPERAAFNAMGRLLDPFISEEILTRKLREAINNRSAETGNPIANPALKEANPDEYYSRLIGHVLTGFEPGAARSARRIWQSATEKGLPSNLDTEQEVLSVFTGQRIRTVDMAEALKWETIGLEQRYRNASRIWTQALNKQGQVTREGLRERYRLMIDAKQDIIEHAHEDVQAVMNFGLSPGEAWAVLRSNNVAKDRAMMMFAGQFVPQPSTDILVGRIESARAEGRTEDAEVFMRRRRLATEVMQEEFERFRERHPSIESKFEETRNLLQRSP